MALRFYNTISQQVEEFHPLEGNIVRVYTCGPTVYNYAHIGNSPHLHLQVLREGGCVIAATSSIMS